MTERLLSRLLLAAFLLGTLYRLFPIVAGQPALSHFFLTEDGYLMLTVARSLAIGLGMTVSDGTIHTNGVQPLATFLFALPYLATGGAKVTSLIGIHLIMAAIALAGALATRAFTARMLPEDADPRLPWLAAALWYVGPKLLGHTMNGLETGLYMLFVPLTLTAFAGVIGKGAATRPADRLALGALCGLTFLARNDGAFLVVAIFLVWGLHELFAQHSGLGRTLARLVPPGLVSLLFAAPWLINNRLYFGSIVPISGQSEALTAHFGQNLALVPATLFEDFFPMLPVPNGLERALPVMAVAGLVSVALGLWFLRQSWRRGGVVRVTIAAYAGYAALIICYYGLYFGAPHFLSRYFAPLAPLAILVALSALLALCRRFAPAQAGRLVAGAGSAGILLSFSLLIRLLLPGVSHEGHFQVVRWIEANVPETTWVGAVQTGTLGYWHDRTINLDGKVNPIALEARRREGNVLSYVVASPIEYLADWIGIAGWATLTTADFDKRFELIVKDSAANLAVLRRRS